MTIAPTTDHAMVDSSAQLSKALPMLGLIFGAAVLAPAARLGPTAYRRRMQPFSCSTAGAAIHQPIEGLA